LLKADGTCHISSLERKNLAFANISGGVELMEMEHGIKAVIQ
jgi:hypothetical protein